MQNFHSVQNLKHYPLTLYISPLSQQMHWLYLSQVQIESKELIIPNDIDKPEMCKLYN